MSNVEYKWRAIVRIDDAGVERSGNNNNISLLLYAKGHIESKARV